MAKYIINRGISTQTTVEAKDFELSNGFFWFEGDDGNTVLTFKADAVTHIRREDDSK